MKLSCSGAASCAAASCLAWSYVVGAALAAPAAARAEEPASSYCEAGYAYADVDESAEVSAGLLGALLVSAEGGGGVRAGCVWRLGGGVHALADYRQYELDGLVASGFPGVIIGPRSDATAREWRLGLGYTAALGRDLSAYGQAAYMRSDDYGDFDTSPAPFAVDDPGARDGVSLEAGLRWRPAERLELSGYGRWDSEGAFGISSRPPEQCCADTPGTLVFEDGGDVRAGAGAALRIAGPVWATLGFETGDIQSSFAGVRVAF